MSVSGYAQGPSTTETQAQVASGLLGTDRDSLTTESAVDSQSTGTQHEARRTTMTEESDNQGSRTVIATPPDTPDWTQKEIGTEWLQRLEAMGFYPENFLRMPVGTKTEEEKERIQAQRHYFMGAYHMELGEHGRALEQYEKALEIWPGNSNIVLGAVRAQIAVNELEEAQARLDKLLEQEPQNIDALLLRAQTYMSRAEGSSGSERRELLNSAVEAFEQARKIQPKNLDALKGLASAHLQQQNLDKIIETYREIVAVDPRDTYSLLILANVLSKTGREQEAISYFEKVIEQRRGYINTYLLLGQLYENMHRDRDALNLYKRALLIDPRNKDLQQRFEGLAVRLAGSRGRKAILNQYESFAKEYPYAGEVQRLYAERLLLEKDIAGAIRQFKKVLELDNENLEVLVALGQLYMEQKKFDEARDYFSRAIEVDPEKVEIYDAVASAMLQTGDRPKAIELYQKAIQSNPKAERLYGSLAQLIDVDGRTTEAIKILEKAVSELGPKPELTASIGLLQEKLRNYPEAIEQYQKAFEGREQDLPLLAKLLSLYLKSGQEEKATALVDSATTGPEDARDTVLALIGETYYNEGYTREGLKYYRNAYDLKPQRLEYVARIVQMLLREKHYEEALKEIEAARENVGASDRARLEQLRGDVFLEQKKYDEAIAIYRKMVKEDPSDLNAYQLLVDALNAARRFDESLKVISEAEKKVTDEEAVKMLRGLTLYKQKNFDRAEAIFKELAKSDSDRADDYYYMLGSVYMDQKRWDQAEKALRQAVKINPVNANALNALGYMYADRNIKLEEARSLVSKALELNPSAPHILDSMGWVYFREGKLLEAREYVEKAAKRMNDAEIFDHLGDIYNELGNKQKAQEMYRNALDLDPERSGVRNKLNNSARR